MNTNFLGLSLSLSRQHAAIRPERSQKGDRRESHRRRRCLRTHFDHPERSRFGIAGHRPSQRPRPRGIQTRHLPGGSSRRARNADAARAANTGEIINLNMAISPEFEANYISQFAGIVRHGTSSLVWNEWTQRIRNALLTIDDPNVRNEAQVRFEQILCHAANMSDDPDGGRNYLAGELEKFADYVGKINQ
jgi:hypothetical protein